MKIYTVIKLKRLFKKCDFSIVLFIELRNNECQKFKVINVCQEKQQSGSKRK